MTAKCTFSSPGACGRRPVVLMLACAIALGVWTENVGARTETPLQHRAKAARRAVRKLDLTPRQARQLLPIIDAAATLNTEAHDRQSRHLAETVDALQDLVREVSLNQGITRNVRKRAVRANRQVHKERRRVADKLVELEAQAAAILSPHQQTRTEVAERPDSPPDDRRDMVPSEPRDEMRHKGRSRSDKPARSLFHPAGAAAVFKRAGVKPSEVVQRAAHILRDETRGQWVQVQRLRNAINNWNLINGLHLSLTQIDEIVMLYDQAGPELRSKRTRRNGPLAKLERDVDEVLSAGQRQFLAEFKPHLIPRKKPARVGRGNATSRHPKRVARPMRKHATPGPLTRFMLRPQFIEQLRRRALRIAHNEPWTSVHADVRAD